MEMLLFCFLLVFCTAFSSIIDLSNSRDVNSTIFNPDPNDPSLISTTSLLLPKLLSSSGKIGDSVIFEVRDQFFIDGTVTSSRFITETQFTIVGFTTNAFSTFSVSYSQGCFSASVSWEGETDFQISSLNCSAGEYVVHEYNSDGDEDEENDEVLKYQLERKEDGLVLMGAEPAKPDTNRILDVAFIYTSEVLAYQGGDAAAVQAVIDEAIALM